VLNFCAALRRRKETHHLGKTGAKAVMCMHGSIFDEKITLKESSSGIYSFLGKSTGTENRQNN
jgi:hypothetical protein